MIVWVKWEDAIKFWPVMEPMFATCTSQTEGRFDTPDLLKEIIEGKQVLWVGYDPERNKIDLVVTTAIITYPRRKVCRLVFIAGTRMMAYKDEFIRAIEKYARDQGATAIEGALRRGWARIWPGTKECGVSLFRELEA